MAKKSVNFDHLTLVDEDTSTKASQSAAISSGTDDNVPGLAASKEGLKEASAHIMTYMSPAAAKALARYALDASTHRKKVKVHDLMLEALEMWFQSKGIQVEVRALPRK